MIMPSRGESSTARCSILNASSMYDDATNEPRQSVAMDLEDRASKRALIGGIVGGVGVGLLVVGVIKLAVSDDRGARTEHAVRVTIGPSSFAIAGSF